MARLQNATSLRWRDGVRLQNSTSLRWREGTRLQSIGTPYTPPPAPAGSTPVTPGNLAAAFAILSRKTYEASHTLNVTDLRTGNVLPVEKVTIALDDGGMYWTLAAEGHYDVKAALEAGEQPAQVQVVLNDDTWRFVVDTINAPQAFASSAVSLTGRSVAALADAPIQFERSPPSNSCLNRSAPLLTDSRREKPR